MRFHKIILIFCSVIASSVCAQNKQEVELIFQHEKTLDLKKLVLLNNKFAVALTRGDKPLKLVNTILLIKDRNIVDKYVSKVSIDDISSIGEKSLNAFQPANSLLNFEILDSKLSLTRKKQIPFYDYQLLFSTSFVVGVLGFYEGYSIYFNQEEKSNVIQKTLNTSYPRYFVYKEKKRIPINPNGEKPSYSHWPSYSLSVMPPLVYIKVLEGKILFVLSNLGKIYSFDPHTQKIEEEEFPNFKGVKSWSIFYDHIENEKYYVSYLGNDLYEIFRKEANELRMILRLNGFFDSITGGWALQRCLKNGAYIYNKIRLNHD